MDLSISGPFRDVRAVRDVTRRWFRRALWRLFGDRYNVILFLGPLAFALSYWRGSF